MQEPVILQETSEYWVINKPYNMAVEPPSTSSTLLDWFMAQNLITPSLWQPEQRYGVIHRLDTDTSGVMLWAKNPEAQESLKQLWQGRQVEKTYVALVAGETPIKNVVELALIRDNKNDRQKVAWLGEPKARPAITHHQRLAVGNVDGNQVSLIQAKPVTGRTHQIRVHCQAMGYPIIGDKQYGNKLTDQLAKELGLTRQFLHASALRLPSGESYTADLPEDLQSALQKAAISWPIS